jgi:hypothetical protein
MSAAVWNIWLPIGLVVLMGVLMVVIPAVVLGRENRREIRDLTAFVKAQRKDPIEKAA